MKKSSCIFLLLIINLHVFSQVEEVKISPLDVGKYGYFGAAVSAIDNYMLVGAYYDDDKTLESPGIAFIYENKEGSWELVSELSPPDGTGGDQFGIGVWITNEHAYVGANHDGTGSIYVFEKGSSDEWNYSQKLVPFDGKDGDIFGGKFSIFDNTLVACSRLNNLNGAAYVFEKKDGLWEFTQKLVASDGEPDDWFGHTASVFNDFIVVGADYDDAKEGSVYVFKKINGTWEEVQKLKASDGEAGDRFGRTVSMYGDYFIASAEWDDDHGTDSGACYMFRLNGDGQWEETQKLAASDASEDDRFGRDFHLYKSSILIGAYQARGAGNNTGAAYFYELVDDSWIEVQKVYASDGNSKDGFGRGLSFSDNFITVGAFKHDVNTTDDGSVYVYPVPSGNPDGNIWSDLEADEKGWGDSGWLGWINVIAAPWIYSYDLSGWLYFPEENVDDAGGWAYLVK